MLKKKPLQGLFFAAEPGSPVREKALQDLEKALGHDFTNKQLLCRALTHSTYAYEHRQKNLANNERLEFLGDAVLDLAVSDALFQQKGRFDEGFMTKTRALLVREETLAQLARNIYVGDLLLLGKGETATGGREKPSNLANAMEAVFGAIYLDAGFARACQVIRQLLDRPFRLALAGDLVYDYKSRLLELVQATRGGSNMHFQILAETGPVHERTFTAGVLVDEQLVATGVGSSKKEAEQNAAQKALLKLDCDLESCVIMEEN